MNVLGQQLSYQQFGVKDGLPSNHVYDITQDADGYMWMGTENGLCRYDGLHFTNYTIFDGLPSTEILAFFKDSKKRIWFYTLSGALGYYHRGKFYSSQNTAWLQTSLKNNTLDINEDEEGNLYFSSFFSLIRIDKNHKVFKYELKNNFPRIVKDDNGKCFIINKLNPKHIVSLPGLKKEALDLKLFSGEALLKFQKAKIAKVRNKNFADYAEKYKEASLLQTDDLQWFYSPSSAVEVFSQSKARALPIDRIVASRAYMDKEGSVWFGSFGKGVYRFQEQVSGVFAANKSLQGGLLSALYIDTIDYRIFCGTTSGLVNVLNWKEDHFERQKKPLVTDARVRGIRRAADNNIWIVTDQNIFLRSARNFSKQNLRFTNSEDNIYIPKSLFVDKQHNAIYISNYVGVHKINSSGSQRIVQTIFDQRTYATHKDAQGDLWFGTTNALYHKKDTTLTLVVKNEPIACLAHLGAYVLAGTKGKGLLLVKNDTVRRISTENGLPSNLIRSIYIDPKQQVWICTNKGLVLLKGIEQEHPELKTYSQENGLVSNDVLDCGMFGQKMCVLSPQGLAIVDLQNKRVALSAAHIQLERVAVNDQAVDTENKKSFAHDENNIQFEFAGIYYGNREDLEYAYQLKGYHEKQQRTKSNTLKLEHIPPGNYTLELFVVVNNKVSENVLRYSFEIKPAWYQYKLVQFLGLLLLFFVSWWFIRQYVNKEKKKNETEKRLTQLEHMALQAQMNPHFIKNALSAIQHLMLNKDMRSANKYLTVFGDLITRLLHRSNDSFIPLSEELEILKLYLSIEQLRFEDNFEYSFNCDEELLDKEIPSMMLQPILENAILHGFKERHQYTSYVLQVNIKYTEGYATCEIVDNGVGIQDHKHKSISRTGGIALNNIQERISLLSLKYQATAIKVESTQGQGTTVILNLPYHESTN